MMIENVDFSNQETLRMEDLTRYHQELVGQLAQVRSLRQLKGHPAFQKKQTVIDKTLKSYQVFKPTSTPSLSSKSFIRMTAWNIERGLAYEGIAHTLKAHPEISQSDIFLLTEVDLGMARTGNRHVAKDLASELNCYGVFAPAYLNLDKGNGGEANIKGSNTLAIQGHAILSRFPITDVEIVSLPNGKDHMSGKERQIGEETVIVASIQTPQGLIHCSPVHLSAHSSRKHRMIQMKFLLQAISKKNGPTIVGGDWNTTTYNAQKPYRAILGFWRRVAMGVHYVILNHYPYPEKYFEKNLFSLLKKHGFETDNCNIPGGCTLHYDFNDPFYRMSLSDWVPQWCFKFIDWALRSHQGRCSFKVDWFAQRGLHVRNNMIAQDLPRGEFRYSDHTPIITDVELVNG